MPLGQQRVRVSWCQHVPPVSPPVSVVAAGFTRTSLWRSWRSWPLAWQLLRAEVWGQRKADA